MSNSRPHVCFVAPYLYPLLVEAVDASFAGGAEVQQLIVARGLVERGYPVSAICLDHGQPEEETIGGIRVLKAYHPGAGFPGLRFVWPRLTAIWSSLRKADADIYYQRVADRLTGIVAHFATRYQRRAVFASAGNPDFQRPTPRVGRALDRRLYEYGIRHVDRIFVQNEEQAVLCRVNYGRDSIELPNCYPRPDFTEIGKGKDVLWVSMIRSVKQPDLFLDLVGALKGHPFQMVGGPDIAEPHLFRKIKERADGLSNLEFQGFVPYSRIDGCFDRAALFINTSESEGFPNTFLQAWARGVPTVSFVDCGARIDGQPIGIRVRSVAEMADAVRRLMEDEGLRKREGERCRRYYEQKHTPENVIAQYAESFDELAERPAPQRRVVPQ